jgi:nucleoid DNA-binding protein
VPTIRMPFVSEEDSEPLAKCVIAGAQSIGISPQSFAIGMTYFLETLASEVSKGRCILISGFGKFGIYIPKSRKDDDIPTPHPQFQPARAFRNEVAFTAPPNQGAHDAMLKYRNRQHPSARPDKDGSRVFTAMDATREQIIVDAAKQGIDVEDLTPKR